MADIIRSRVHIRDEVADFAEQMERTLLANDWKGGWQGMTLDECMARIYEEVAELDAARHHFTTAQERGHLAEEAADVANFCMFLVWNAKRLNEEAVIVRVAAMEAEK